MTTKLSAKQIEAVEYLTKFVSMTIKRNESLASANVARTFDALVKRGIAEIYENSDDTVTYRLISQPEVAQTAEPVQADPEVSSEEHTQTDEITLDDQGVDITAPVAEDLVLRPTQTLIDKYGQIVGVIGVDCTHCKFREATQFIDDLPYCDVCTDNIKVHADKPAKTEKPVKAAKAAETAPAGKAAELDENGAYTLVIENVEGEGGQTVRVNSMTLKPKLCFAIAEKYFSGSKFVKCHIEGADYGYDIRFMPKRGRMVEWRYEIEK